MQPPAFTPAGTMPAYNFAPVNPLLALARGGFVRDPRVKKPVAGAKKPVAAKKAATVKRAAAKPAPTKRAATPARRKKT